MQHFRAMYVVMHKDRAARAEVVSARTRPRILVLRLAVRRSFACLSALLLAATLLAWTLVVINPYHPLFENDHIAIGSTGVVFQSTAFCWWRGRITVVRTPIGTLNYFP